MEEKEVKDLETILTESDELVEDNQLSTDVFDEFFADNVGEEFEGVPYTTELLENIQKLDPSLTPEQLKEVFEYLKGSGRPEFMDEMMTQTNEKLNETIKLMSILYLYKVPVLLDYQKTLQKNLLDPTKIPNMSYEEISKVSANIQKEISDLLTFALNVSKSLSSINTVPTKVEKLAQSLLYVSDATRERIMEIVEAES